MNFELCKRDSDALTDWRVKWISEYKKLKALEAKVSTLQSENAELRAMHRTEHCEATGYDCEELGRLRAALAHAEKERDAAIADISHVCVACGWFQDGACPVLAYKDYPKDCEHWQWRGEQGVE